MVGSCADFSGGVRCESAKVGTDAMPGVVLALCNALNLDLSEAIAAKMAKNVVKYPVEKVRGRYRVEE